MKSILVVLFGLAYLFMVCGMPTNKTMPALDKLVLHEASGDVADEEVDERTPEDDGKTNKTGIVYAPRNSAEKMQEQQAEQNPDLFEGDIILTKKQKKQLKAAKTRAKSGKKETITGQGRPWIGQRWPNGRVPYEFDNNFGEDRRVNVREAIGQFNDRTCVRFVPKTNADRTWMKFTVGQGCSSPIGHVSQRGQPISIGNGCNFVGTIMHEMMHCIGFWHEQSRRDRDDHIEIIERNIDTDLYGVEILRNFEMYRPGEGDSREEAYDLGSLMHYPNNAFGRSDSRGNLMTTIRALVNPRMVLGQRDGFSESDVRQINALYECRNNQ